MNTAAAASHFEATTAKHYRWEELPLETMKGTITRRLITSDRMMIAHVYLKKGDDVPRHSHENEQITYILEGALQFLLGANGERELIVRAGEVLVIPSYLPHSALGARRYPRRRCIQSAATRLAYGHRCLPAPLRCRGTMWRRA